MESITVVHDGGRLKELPAPVQEKILGLIGSLASAGTLIKPEEMCTMLNTFIIQIQDTARGRQDVTETSIAEFGVYCFFRQYFVRDPVAPPLRTKEVKSIWRVWKKSLHPSGPFGPGFRKIREVQMLEEFGKIAGGESTDKEFFGIRFIEE